MYTLVMEQEESRMTFFMISPSEYRNNSVYRDEEEEVMLRLLITYHCTSKTPLNWHLEEVQIGSKTFPVKSMSESRNTVIPG